MGARRLRLILDVGCGSRPRGNVNVDLFLEKSEHRYTDIDLKKIPNFVNASVNYLPFRDNTFFKTICVSVLEHRGVDFYKALNEMLRVSSNYVEFRVPTLWCLEALPSRHKGHKHVFTSRMIRQVLKNYCYEIMVEHTGRLWRFIPLFFPRAWTVRVWK